MSLDTHNMDRLQNCYWPQSVMHDIVRSDEKVRNVDISLLKIGKTVLIMPPIYRFEVSEFREIELPDNTGHVTIPIEYSIAETSRLRPAVSSLEACPASAR